MNTSWLVDVNTGDWLPANVGGKAHHLSKMVKWGLQVPAFGVLSTKVFNSWKTDKHISKPLIELIHTSLDQWNATYFAVRSSMSLEDGNSTSFAGIFDTFLFVEKKDVFSKVLECYQSIYSDRASMYMTANNLDIEKLGVSVVVQVMVDARCSGVSFSRNPQGHSGFALIESGLGLGEGVVSGLVDVDRYSVDRFGKVWEAHIADKIKRTLYNAEKKSVEVCEVKDSQGEKPSLSSFEIGKIFSGLILAEDQLNRPVDMEWAIDQTGKLFFLQTRPITQKFKDLNYFADTNLAESYPNVVSRFTADFVPKAYEKVIGETLHLLGARWKNTANSEKMNSVLKGLIAHVHGHLYYQLENYYTVLYTFPGGEANIHAWHNMIGGHSLTIPYQKINLFPGIKKHLPYLRILYFLLRHASVYGKFINNRFQELEQKKTLISKATTSREASKLAKQFFTEVDQWGLTSLNDIFVILGLKILNALIKKYNLDSDIITEWLKTDGHVDSIDALIELKKLQKNLNLLDKTVQKRFWDITQGIIDHEERTAGHTWQLLFAAYDNEGWPDKSQLISGYLQQFGERCFEELKIESLPFSESPSEFFKVFRQEISYVESKNTKKVKTLLNQMSFVDQLILKLVLHFSTKAVSARESTRLMRGRFYGLLRSAVLKSAQLFIEENQSLNAQLTRQDFFGLTMDELSSYGHAEISVNELIDLLQQRKKIKSEQKPVDYPELYCASADDLEPYFLAGSGPVVALESNQLSGLGVSTGIVTGYALVLTDPREALSVPDLHEKILVTRSTDPAWIFIMSKCRGLISEKGSLLSHTAIVGRELGIPTVVGVQGATQLIKSAAHIRINGKTGLIELL